MVVGGAILLLAASVLWNSTLLLPLRRGGSGAGPTVAGQGRPVVPRELAGKALQRLLPSQSQTPSMGPTPASTGSDTGSPSRVPETPSVTGSPSNAPSVAASPTRTTAPSVRGDAELYPTRSAAPAPKRELAWAEHPSTYLMLVQGQEGFGA